MATASVLGPIGAIPWVALVENVAETIHVAATVTEDDERACGGRGSDADKETANYPAIIARGKTRLSNEVTSYNVAVASVIIYATQTRLLTLTSWPFAPVEALRPGFIA